MKDQNRYGRLAWLCLLLVLVMATGVLMTACRGGDTPVGEPSETQGETTPATNTQADAVTEAPSADKETTGASAEESGSQPSEEQTGSDATQPQEPEGGAETGNLETTLPPEPAETEPPQPSDTESGTLPTYILYEQYQILSGAEQLAYFESFPSPEEFFIWYNAAVADFQERNPGVEIGPGGDIVLP